MKIKPYRADDVLPRISTTVARAALTSAPAPETANIMGAVFTAEATDFEACAATRALLRTSLDGDEEAHDEAGEAAGDAAHEGSEDIDGDFDARFGAVRRVAAAVAATFADFKLELMSTSLTDALASTDAMGSGALLLRL